MRSAYSFSPVRRRLRCATLHLALLIHDLGKGFVEEARKMHYGETEERSIYGEADLAEARALLRTVLADTRAFEGCLGVEVWVDEENEAHVVAHETSHALLDGGVERVEVDVEDRRFGAHRPIMPAPVLLPRDRRRSSSPGPTSGVAAGAAGPQAQAMTGPPAARVLRCTPCTSRHRLPQRTWVTPSGSCSLL